LLPEATRQSADRANKISPSEMTVMRKICLPATVTWLPLFLLGCSHVMAMQANESPAVWGLKAGDSFVINVFIVKQTEFTVEGQPPETNETRDRFEIEYTVATILKSGDALITVRLKRATREAGDSTSESLKTSVSSARSLEELRLRFQVDILGQITEIDRRDKEAFLVALSSLDPSAWQMLRDTCSDEAISGWFSRPFWTALASDPTIVDREPNAPPVQATPILERVESMALGPFGMLNTSIQLQPAKGKDDEPGFTISGTGRFVPLVVPESRQAQGRLPFKEVTAELDEFSGRVRLAKAEPQDPNAPPTRRTMNFQSMETTARFHGSSLLQTSPEEEARKVSFRQTQIQLWILAEQTEGRREMPFGVPGPLDAR